MRTVAIASQKGGSCKTTTAVCLGAAMAAAGDRVLLVDLDPQGSSTAWLAGTPQTGLFELFGSNGSIVKIAAPTGVPGLDLVPASPHLVGAERALAGEVGIETVLRQALAKVPAGRWDVVLLDTPPSLGLLSIAALAAANGVLVPVVLAALTLGALATLLPTIERVRERLNPRLGIDAIVPCRYDVRTNLSQDITDRLREKFGALVTTTVIRESVRLAECPSFQKPIGEYAPGSAGDEDYTALAKELRGRARKKGTK